MKPKIAALLNFFLPGAAYLLLGHKTPLAVIGLTYVEQIHTYDKGNLQAQDGTAFAVMFVSVLIMNTAFAIDAYKVGTAAK
jgi:hypothetical protein